jgi:lysophospholipase L1-like esterase
MKRFFLGLVFLTATSVAAQNPETPSIPLTVTNIGVPCPDCKEGERVPIHSVARALHRTYQWPGAYWEANIKGTSFDLILNGKTNIFSVYVDGKKVDTQSKPIYTTFHYSRLSEGPHHIRVEAQTESQGSSFMGVSRILVRDTDSVLPAPAPRARQIEYIGDSDMVGYANTSTKRECTKAEVFETTDSHKAYPAQVAHKYNADFQLNAYSGIGIVRNYGGSEPDRPMPVLYPRVLFDDPTPYDRKGWAPQVIVIALGGNDFSTPLKPGEKWKDVAALRADWEATFLTFLADIRAQNPKAFILLGLQDGFNEDYFAASKSVLTAYKATGDTKIDAVVYPKLESTACDWHPSLNDHKTMADIVASFIDQRPNIWQGK